MMNINEIEVCILCRSQADKSDGYYVRSDTRMAVTELIKKLPSYLVKLFDFHPTHVSAVGTKVPFCCRQCKRLLEKRQKLLDNVASTEAQLRDRRKTNCVRTLFTADEGASAVRATTSDETLHAAHSTCGSSAVPADPDCVGPLHSTPLASRHSEVHYRAP